MTIRCPKLSECLVLVGLCGLHPGAVHGQGAPARSCETDARYRQFDFWIGSWRVVDADGHEMGTNRIEKLLNGCVLQENWSGARGGSGKSFNYYDPEAGEWRQLWVNASGGHITYEGGFSNGAMRFRGTMVAPDGTATPSRMTFTPLPDGRVRQVIEGSRDGGKTWRKGFEGFYVRTGAAPGSAP